MTYVLPMRHEIAANWLRGSIRNQGAQIAADLKERMAVVLEEGEDPPDVEHFMDVLARMVKHESVVLDAADRIRTAEGGEVKWLLGQRAQADAETRAMVIAIRNRMRGFYGPRKANRLLHVKGRTPLNTEELELMAGRLVRHLADAEMPPVDGCEVDTSGWAERLRPAWQRLHDVIDELATRRPRKEAGVIAKKQALKTSARTYSRAVRLLELIYQLAGHGWLAKRLRRKLRGHPRGGKASDAAVLDPRESADSRDRLLTWLSGFSEPASRWLHRRRRPPGAA